MPRASIIKPIPAQGGEGASGLGHGQGQRTGAPRSSRSATGPERVETTEKKPAAATTRAANRLVRRCGARWLATPVAPGRAGRWRRVRLKLASPSWP